MSKYKDRDLEQHMREEQARGTRKRTPDQEAMVERKLRLELIKDLLWLDDKAVFLKVLTDDYGIQPGSPPYLLALEAWNERHRRGGP